MTSITEMKNNYLGIDIGGSWIKGTMLSEYLFDETKKNDFRDLNIQRVCSPLKPTATLTELAISLESLIEKFGVNNTSVKAVGISTPGIVNYSGRSVKAAAEHLNILKNKEWINELEQRFDCRVSVINDADAAMIGIAELGRLTGDRSIGIMPVGTGLGFSVWRNGRRWRPGKIPNLLGSIRTPAGSYDKIASASVLASQDEEKNLIKILTDTEYDGLRNEYIRNLSGIINTAAILYNLSEVIVCGGIADAANTIAYPLEQKINNILLDTPAELDKPVKITVPPEGNNLQLIGALALAKGEFVAARNRVVHSYKDLETEIPYREDIQLQNMTTLDIAQTLWQAEEEAGEMLESSLPVISEIIDKSESRIKSGGRIIYVGAGTSGRIAAMDAVEIPCTYGFPGDRILAVIAGGVSDAAIEIESDFEEDASAVPEMLILNVQPEDVVIGISASGSAYFVQSALAFAKDRKALSIMVQTNSSKALSFCDYVIPLNSGYEVVAGSTRMKAGTATKKVLNFISSCIMIKIGKVDGPYMVDVACINNKLVQRAQEILHILYGMDKEEALKRLKKEEMKLNQVIKKINAT